MVNWKVALVVVIVVVLVMAVGMWLGYRYVSEQNDISPEGWRERSHTTDLHLDKLFVLAPTRELHWNDVPFCERYSSLCLFEKRRFKV